MLMRPLGLVTLACVLGIACGGGQPEPTTAGQTASEAPVTSAPVPADPAPPPDEASVAPTGTEPPSTDKAWKDKTREEKVAIMKTVVMPKMKAHFQTFDEKEFKEFTCVTCHGPGAKEGKFDMPNDKLPKLNPKDGFKKHTDKHPKMTKFMMTTVVPEMASALGVQPFDPKTSTGFGCGGCHQIDH
jgi:hypothetical protein